MSTGTKVLMYEDTKQRLYRYLEDSGQIIYRYQCWRITREFTESMESCPDGNLNECLCLPVGAECPGGHLVIV